MSTTIIFKCDEELKEQFALAVKGIDRSTSQVLRDFMRDFVKSQTEKTAYDSWLQEKIDLSRKAALEGKVVNGDDVEKLFAKRRASLIKQKS